MICPQCGQYNEDTARFCGNCGTDLSAVAAQVAEQQASAQPAYTPDYASQPAQPAYPEGTGAFPQTQQPSQPPAPYDTGATPVQPQGYDYSQQPQQAYDPAQQYAQPQQGYAPQPDQYQQQAPAADPYSQQQYAQQQYPQGYNAPVEQPKKKFPVLPVVLGIVAVIAVVGGFFLFRGSGNVWALTQTYRNSTAGCSFMGPAGGSVDDMTDGDFSQQRVEWTSRNKPNRLTIDTYVMSGVSGLTPGEVAEDLVYMYESYNMSVVEVGDDYCIVRGTDPNDGDTNYQKAIIRGDEAVMIDVYYEPAYESTMRDVALEIMESFSA